MSVMSDLSQPFSAPVGGVQQLVIEQSPLSHAVSQAQAVVSAGVAVAVIVIVTIKTIKYLASR